MLNDVLHNDMKKALRIRLFSTAPQCSNYLNYINYPVNVAFDPEYKPEAESPTVRPANTMVNRVPPTKNATPNPSTSDTKGAHLLGKPTPFNTDTTPRITGTAPNRTGLITIASI